MKLVHLACLLLLLSCSAPLSSPPSGPGLWLPLRQIPHGLDQLWQVQLNQGAEARHFLLRLFRSKEGLQLEILAPLGGSLALLHWDGVQLKENPSPNPAWGIVPLLLAQETAWLLLPQAQEPWKRVSEGHSELWLWQNQPQARITPLPGGAWRLEHLTRKRNLTWQPLRKNAQVQNSQLQHQRNHENLGH